MKALEDEIGWAASSLPMVNTFLLQRSAGRDALRRQLQLHISIFLKLKIMRHSRVPLALLRLLSFNQRTSGKGTTKTWVGLTCTGELILLLKPMACSEQRAREVSGLGQFCGF